MEMKKYENNSVYIYITCYNVINPVYFYQINIKINAIPIVASQKWSLATSGAKQTKIRKLLLKFLVLKNEKLQKMFIIIFKAKNRLSASSQAYC